MEGAALQFVNVLSTWWCTVSNHRHAWLTIYFLFIDWKIYEIERVFQLFGDKSYSGPLNRNIYVRVFIHKCGGPTATLLSAIDVVPALVLHIFCIFGADIPGP